MTEFQVYPPRGVEPGAEQDGQDIRNEISRYFPIDHTQIARGGVRNINLHEDARFAKAIVSTSIAGGDFGPDQIQNAIDYVVDLGGGIVFVRDGTYIIPSSLTMYGGVQLVGESTSGTIIDCTNAGITNPGIGAIGSSRGTTGTVSLTYGSATVTGVGTNFQPSVVAGDTLEVGFALFEVATISSDTSLTITTAYEGPSVTGEKFHIFSPLRDFSIRNLTFTKSPNDAAILVENCVDFSVEDVLLFDNEFEGLEVNSSSGFNIGGITATAGNSTGISIGGVGSAAGGWRSKVIIKDLISTNNDGVGIYLSVLHGSKISNIFSSFNNNDGIVFNDCVGTDAFGVNSYENADDNILITRTSNSVFSNIISDKGVGDGIEIANTSTGNRLVNLSLDSNAGYGLNISSATDTTVRGIYTNNNTSGAILDNGIGTIIKP